MYFGIVTKTNPKQWFCKKCRKSNDILYRSKEDKKFRACENCVTEEIKKETHYFTDTREYLQQGFSKDWKRESGVLQ